MKGREVVRILALAGALSLSVGLGAQAAAPEWNEYRNDELGYIVELPSTPVHKTGVYRSRILANAPSRYAIVETPTNIFSVAVIQAGDVDPLAIISETDFAVTQFGEVLLNNVTRTGPTNWGRFITVACDESYAVLPEGGGPDPAGRIRGMIIDSTGIRCPTGSVMSTTMFFKNGQLYLLAGVNLGPTARNSGAAAHFVSSLSWGGANMNAIDHAQRGEEPPPGAPAPQGGY